MKYIVLSSKPYDFTNDKGERVNGVKIAYINKKPTSREGEYGHPPMITSCSVELVKGKQLDQCPAIYEMDFEQVTGKNNKPELMLCDLEFVSPVDFSLFFTN